MSFRLEVLTIPSDTQIHAVMMLDAYWTFAVFTGQLSSDVWFILVKPPVTYRIPFRWNDCGMTTLQFSDPMDPIFKAKHCRALHGPARLASGSLETAENQRSLVLGWPDDRMTGWSGLQNQHCQQIFPDFSSSIWVANVIWINLLVGSWYQAPLRSHVSIPQRISHTEWVALRPLQKVFFLFIL